MTGIVIDIRSKSYPVAGRRQRRIVIENLRLTLRPMEFVCVVGPSGCGKTTLLNIVAGLERDFEGGVRLVRGNGDKPVVGYVFQQPRLLPWRTVRENIELVLKPARPHESVDALLAAMDLTAHQHVYPQRLSLGMSRRVALARAFVMQPDLLLMDEPFVSLDAPTARRIRKLLVDVWQERPHTVLFVTHDLREAIQLADRILFLRPCPTGLLEDLRVPIPRDQRLDEEVVESFRQSLLRDHPALAELL